MAGCCDRGGYDRVFGERFARSMARRYRRRGLGRVERRMVEFLVDQGLSGATVLEIGGGVGELQIELLRRGAARATGLELVGAYEQEARSLAEAAGVEDRLDRRILDIAAAPGEVEAADIVVLHRVVCCYPDYERLLAAAADHARRMLVFSYPPRHVGTRLALVVENLFYRVTRNDFRAYLHPPLAMVAVLERGGLQPAYRHAGPIWAVSGLLRPPA